MDKIFALSLSRAAILAGGCLFALYSAWFSFGVALSKSHTDLIGGVLVGNHLVAEQVLKKSYANDVRRNSGIVSESIAKRYVVLAQDVYKQEPLSQFSISVLAMDPAIDKSKARQIMQLSLKLSRRNSVASAWLANDAIVRGDIRGVLYYYDLIMFRQNSESKEVLRALVELLADERSIPFFVEFLREYSDWHLDFWTAALDNNKAIRNSWRVRDGLVDLGYTPDKRIDELIIARLVEFGYYKQAWLLYPRVRKEIAEFVNGRSAVNLDFDRRTQLEPYFWVLNDLTGEVGASINSDSNSLDLSMVGRTSGSVVKRLVYLPGRRYQVDLREGLSSGSSADLEYRIGVRCVDSSSGSFSVELERSSDRLLSGELRIRPEFCEFFWVDLFVMNNGVEGVDVSVQNIMMRPVV